MLAQSPFLLWLFDAHYQPFDSIYASNRCWAQNGLTCSTATIAARAISGPSSCPLVLQRGEIRP